MDPENSSEYSTEGQVSTSSVLENTGCNCVDVHQEISELKNMFEEVLEKLFDKDNQTKGLIEINQRLIHEQLGTPNAAQVVANQKNIVDENRKKEH